MRESSKEAVSRIYGFGNIIFGVRYMAEPGLQNRRRGQQVHTAIYSCLGLVSPVLVQYLLS